MTKAAADRKVQELGIFHDVAKALTSSLDLDSILQTIMEKMAEYFRPDNWSLLMVDEGHDELYFAIAVGDKAEALKNGFASEVAAIKREYYRICVGLLDGLKAQSGAQFSTRIAVLSLFGMMNWIYTWHNPRVDADAASIAREMGDVFLRGTVAAVRLRCDFVCRR